MGKAETEAEGLPWPQQASGEGPSAGRCGQHVVVCVAEMVWENRGGAIGAVLSRLVSRRLEVVSDR